MVDKKIENSFRNTTHENKLSKVVITIKRWVIDALKPNKMTKIFFAMIISEICGISRRQIFKVKMNLLQRLTEEQHPSTLSPLILSFLRKQSPQLRTLDMILEE